MSIDILGVYTATTAALGGVYVRIDGSGIGPGLYYVAGFADLRWLLHLESGEVVYREASAEKFDEYVARYYKFLGKITGVRLEKEANDE